MKAINQLAGQATIWLTAIAMMFPLSALAQGSRVKAPNNRFRASDDEFATSIESAGEPPCLSHSQQ